MDEAGPAVAGGARGRASRWAARHCGRGTRGVGGLAHDIDGSGARCSVRARSSCPTSRSVMARLRHRDRRASREAGGG